MSSRYRSEREDASRQESETWVGDKGDIKTSKSEREFKKTRDGERARNPNHT